MEISKRVLARFSDMGALIIHIHKLKRELSDKEPLCECVGRIHEVDCQYDGNELEGPCIKCGKEVGFFRPNSLCWECDMNYWKELYPKGL